MQTSQSLLQRSSLNLRAPPDVPVTTGRLVQYKYRVNGEWATSPCEPITGDGSGCFNNQRLVAPSAAFHWQARAASCFPCFTS